ncbi:MAG TPA: hypothetical protein DCG53_07525 [Syntrophus sp. (in: bacteria)]|nr:hypothetical protein [Syntrophus sp. (in: bacteria)]
MGASSDKKQSKLSREANDDKGKGRFPPVKHRIHLKGPEDVRRLLSAVINDLRQQKIDPLVSGKIVYAAQTLLDVFKQHDFVVMLRELEELIKQSGYARR